VTRIGRQVAQVEWWVAWAESQCMVEESQGGPSPQRGWKQIVGQGQLVQAEPEVPDFVGWRRQGGQDLREGGGHFDEASSPFWDYVQPRFFVVFFHGPLGCAREGKRGKEK
jgi:hypothetical protein